VTNTLHRRGAEDDLRRDFVLFCMPARSITPELPAKLRRFTEIARRHQPVNANRLEGRSVTAIDLTRIDEELEGGICLHAVYDNVEAVAGAVRDLVEADLGLPINVSGPLAEVQDCCRRAGITRHSVEQSLGTKGRVERLPRPEVVELNSLCGHGLVGYGLIDAVISQVRTARIGVEEAARLLARPCQCGCFNPTRAGEILERARTGG
jgi:hypothetical protein